MGSTTGEATSRDGRVLCVRRWPESDAGGRPWASVLIVHGLGEHSGRYEHVGAQLTEAGLQVQAVDLRGFGSSAGPRADVETWAEFEDDVGSRVDALRAEATASGDPARPIAVFAHSMGGLIATGALIDGLATPDLLVLSAPGIDSSDGWLLRQAARLAQRFRPTLRVYGRIRGDLLSRDPDVGRRLNADPMTVASATARFGAEAFAAQRRVRDQVARLTALGVPTLVLHGADDRRVPPGASEGLASLADVTRRVYPGLRHELHNEPEGPEIVAAVIVWLRGAAAVVRARRRTEGR